MYLIGLTGGIGSGKSTVANYFEKELKIEIISADKIGHEVLKDKNVIKVFSKKFGENILIDGNIDRKKLREILINSKDNKIFIDNTLHPIIRDKIYNTALKSKSRYTIIEIPLLDSKNISNYNFLNKVITVVSNIDLVLKRIMNRDNQTKDQALKIIKIQTNNEERIKIADFVIYNNDDLVSLNSQILKIDRALNNYV